MGNKFLARQRKIVGLGQLAIMSLFWIWFLFFTPVTPLSGSLREGASENPILADGLWGDIGFYTRAADNELTYFLMVLFCGLIVYKIIISSFFPHRDNTHNYSTKERRGENSAGLSARLKPRKF